jgi:hypothetical protein
MYPDKFKGADRDQWKRFKALPNVVVEEAFASREELAHLLASWG